MKNIQDIEVKENVSLKNYNTYKIESKARYFINIKNRKALREVLEYLKLENISYFILGAGSNVILDDYFDGAILKLSFREITIKGNTVTADAGAMMSSLAMETVNNHLTGLEWAFNIPGSIGGSINGNAGAYNSCIFDNLVEIEVMDLNTYEIKNIKKDDIEYSYRYTNIKELNYLILAGTFLLEEGNKESSMSLILDRQERRKNTQPLDYPSAGSVFRNPLNDHAGRLIEECGLKGTQIGGAKVSEKHANFIVNTGSSTSQDIKNLIKLVKDTVKEKYNIDLILEQEIVDWK